MHNPIIFIFVSAWSSQILKTELTPISPPVAEYDILNTTFPDQWIPPTLPTRKDLQCSCESRENVDDTCCVCTATPIWAGKEVRNCLFVERVSVSDRSVVVYAEPVNMSLVYIIAHTSEELTEFPINICNWGMSTESKILSLYAPYIEKFSNFWTRIVTIYFSMNKIKAIPGINCLTNLDTLDLSYNEVGHISNTSFNNLPHLRKLLLPHNHITAIDPSVFMAPKSHLWFVDVSFNSMTSIDVTNMHTLFPFCKMDFRNNELEEITNLVGFKLDINGSYGPGNVWFNGNSFETFPDFQEVFQLDDLSQLGKVLRSGFDFRDTEFSCDCHMELYCELAVDCIEMLWVDYMDVKCASPPHLRGVAIVNVSLDDLVCDLSDDIDCPVDCVCTDQPSLRTVHVNCSNTGKTELPPTVPQSKYSPNINLNMSGNEITVVHDVPYLHNVTKLDLSNNELIGIDEEAAGALENASLDISENEEFHTLPKSLQYRSICSLQMDNLQLTCDCDSSWISSWVSVKGCNNTNSLTCNVPGHGLVPVDEFSTGMLDCERQGLPVATISCIVGGLAVTLAAAGLLIRHFRYEILILVLRTRSIKPSAVAPTFEYDAFLSFDEESEHLRQWTIKKLVAYLSEQGYRSYVPCKDLPFGETRSNETILALQNTKTFILLLSESYLTQEDRIFTDNEWKYGWNMYKSNASKKIIIINFDHISSFDVDHPQIKAYLRVGENIDFANHYGNIMETIATKLGPPCVARPKSSEDANERFGYKRHPSLEPTGIGDSSEETKNASSKTKFKEIEQASKTGNVFVVENLITERQRPVGGVFKYYLKEQQLPCGKKGSTYV